MPVPRPQGERKTVFSVTLLHFCVFGSLSSGGDCSSLCENTQLSLPCSSFVSADLSLIYSQTLRGIFGAHGLFQQLSRASPLRGVQRRGAPGPPQSRSSTVFTEHMGRCLGPSEVWNRFPSLGDTGSRDAGGLPLTQD